MTRGDDMTRPNAELAYRVLDHIDAHPEQPYAGREGWREEWTA